MSAAPKVLPMHGAPESEAALLDAILQGDQYVLDVVLELLSPSDFVTRAGRAVLGACIALLSREVPIAPPAVVEQLRSTGELEKIGGTEAVVGLVRGDLGVDAKHHAGVIRERSMLRRLHQAAHVIADDAVAPNGSSAAEVVDRAERRILEIAEGTDGEGLVSVRTAMPELVDAMEGEGPVGIPTGMRNADRLLGALKPGELYLVAARPSMGKSSFCLQLALSAAIEHGQVAAIFSVEMTRLQNMQRIAALETLVDLSHIVNRRLSDDEMIQFSQHISRVYQAGHRLWIDDTARTVAEMRSRARRLKSREGLGLVVVDHVHLMRGDGDDRNAEVSNISRGLKALAKELHVPLVAACQLSRAPMQRADHRPQLSDLRDSGSLEQDADVVVFLHRPEYYVTPAEAQEKNLIGRAEANVAKQRNGPTGSIELYFRKEATRFEDWSEAHQQELGSWAIPAAPRRRP